VPLATNPGATTTGPITTNSSIPGRTSTTSTTPTATSPTPSHSSGSSKSNGGKHDGIAIGSAIGSVVGAVLLAGLLFFFVQRIRQKRQAKNYEQHTPPQDGAVGYAEKGYAAATVASAAGALPQPVEDNKILTELSNLRDKIKNHAQSYYHANPVDASQLNQSSISGISKVIGISTPALQNTLLNPSTRVSGIRACIAGVIFSRFGGLKGVSGDSILPLEMAASADAFENVRDEGKTDPNWYCECSLIASDHAKLLSRSKSITGANFQKHNQSSFQGEAESIARATKSINDIVGPFVQNDGQRLKNLDGILRRASQFAVLLYSQPSLWRFDWQGSMASHATTAGSSPQRGIVVLPALLQITSDEAEILSPPRVFSQAEVVN
jgi:hypothetical protein